MSFARYSGNGLGSENLHRSSLSHDAMYTKIETVTSKQQQRQGETRGERGEVEGRNGGVEREREKARKRGETGE